MDKTLDYKYYLGAAGITILLLLILYPHGHTDDKTTMMIYKGIVIIGTIFIIIAIINITAYNIGCKLHNTQKYIKQRIKKNWNVQNRIHKQSDP